MPNQNKTTLDNLNITEAKTWDESTLTRHEWWLSLPDKDTCPH